MMDLEQKPQGAETCPKRPWVLMSLSDDEPPEADGSLSPALAFHLSRCESCRGVADRLRSVFGALHELSSLDPPAGLSEAARAQACAALDDGAALTGRVAVPDEPVFPNMAGGWRGRRLTRYVAAAAVLAALGLGGLSLLVSSDGERVAADRPLGDPTHVPIRDATDQADRRGSGAKSFPAPSTPPTTTGTDGLDRLADTAHPPRTATHRRVRRHRSHIEAAMSNDPSGAQAAIVLPDTSRRDLGWGRVFDRRRAVRSTEDPKRKR